MRTGESYFREAKHLRKLKETLDLDYELDRVIKQLLAERRKALLAELNKKENPLSLCD